MIAVRGYDAQRVAVLGLGRTGLAAALALTAGGARVVVWDDSAERRAEAEARGLEVADLSRGRAWEGLALLVVSPGIPHLYPSPHPAVRRAWDEGVPVDNDIGLFFRSLATPGWDVLDEVPRVVAVTGSNGKSTTSALVHHILSSAGRPTQLAGNIGRSVLDIDPPEGGGVVVLELSSYQLELARALTPDVAVFTNLSPDHLDRHGGRGGYFAAKRRLFAEGGPDRAIIGVDEDEGAFLASQLAEGPGDDRVIRVSVQRKLDRFGWSVFVRKGFLSEYRRGRQVASIDLRAIAGLPGRHNHQNAASAYAACRALGLAPRQIEAALHGFEGLPHRSQLVAERDGVRFVNDSKATNVDAAAQALQAFDRIRWIAGGLGKEGGITPLAPHFGRVAKAYLYGHSAREFALSLGNTPHEVFRTLPEAVARATAEAEPGDTVLLAPAAASFDQYPDFEARGEDFVRVVRAILDGTDKPADQGAP
ncbi:MAG: UDP-N-acetylmuramoyl-L-alanine--D-glutamate ligase [Alphaproteobacteria bacterium]|nr:MAG: UDP-N-acetylmuramoyl-L-alanine--D-glutamate ligase [Alphaproteobacteria bacterium]